jgi:signal transduction histidine kinase
MVDTAAPSTRQRLRWRPHRVDVVLTAVLVVLSVATYLAMPVQPELGVRHGPDAVGLLLVLTATVPLLARRVVPVTVALLTVAALCASAFYGCFFGIAQLGVLGAVASMAYFARLRRTLLAGAAIIAAINVTMVTMPTTTPVAPVELVTNAAILAVVLGAGSMLRRERHAVARMRQAEQREQAAALREQATALREAAAQDRVRIAREMHDTIGHALTAITLQARVAQRQVHRDADAAAATLAAIDHLAAQALLEARHTVGLIRGDTADDDSVPQHRLADLPDLVATIPASEVRVELQRLDNHDGLPPVVQSAAYRIVQESISNIIKHAGPTRAVVNVKHDADILVLDIRDNGPGIARPPNGGHGLRGMRERVTHLGGSLIAGPAPSGGWRVHARIPCPRPDPAPVAATA